MASGKPRDYGRRPHQLNKGETFDSVARKDTDFARRARGEKWKHSDDKKPYAIPPWQGYDDMERTNTPYLKFPKLSVGDLDLGGTYPWSCICLGEFGKPIGLSRSIGCDAVEFDIKIPEGGLPPTASSDNADAEDEVITNCFKAHVYTEGQIIDPTVDADPSFWRAVAEGRLPNPATTQYVCANVVDCYICSALLLPDCTNVCEERTITINYGYGQSFDLLLVPDPSCGGNCDTLAIIDAGGGAADDTIGQNTTNSYSTTGCAGSVTWAIDSYGTVEDGGGCGSGDAPTISSGGVLSANDATGVITISATCASCGTSDTFGVRVTDSPTPGVWTLKWVCECQSADLCSCGLCATQTKNYFNQGDRYDIYWRCCDGNCPCSVYDYSACGGCSPSSGACTPDAHGTSPTNCGACSGIQAIQQEQYFTFGTGC